MSILKILTDSCVIKQKTKIKNAFAIFSSKGVLVEQMVDRL